MPTPRDDMFAAFTALEDVLRGSEVELKLRATPGRQAEIEVTGNYLDGDDLASLIKVAAEHALTLTIETGRVHLRPAVDRF